MKTYLFVVISFLLVGQLTLSDESSKDPNASISKPKDPKLTEADQSQPTVCVECGKGITHPAPQVEELVINWDAVKSRYSFSSLPKDDQAAILKSLDAKDRETVVQRAERLGFQLDKAKNKQKNPLDTVENIKDLIRAQTGGITGKIGRTKTDGKNKPKITVEWKKEW